MGVWKALAGGSFGKVYLQNCVEGNRKIEQRAVKRISKHKSVAKNIDYVAELEAMAKFSQRRVRSCCFNSSPKSRLLWPAEC